MALGLPETEEILTWGTDVTFRVRSKIFKSKPPAPHAPTPAAEAHGRAA